MHTTAAPIPNPTPTPLPSLGATPTGEWTGIRWISAGPVFPQTPTAGTAKGSFATVSVYGWSRGYVGFRTAIDQIPSTSLTMVSTFSADGLHWTTGRPMDVAGLESWVDITQVVEGPSGLLAVGRYPGAACGGPSTIDALWTSTDGLTWSLVRPSADFASARVFWVDFGFDRSLGVVVGDSSSTSPSSRGGTGFSQFFGLNDLFTTSVPSITDTGMSGSDTLGLADDGSISFVLKNASGAVATTAKVAITAGMWPAVVSAPRPKPNI